MEMLVEWNDEERMARDASYNKYYIEKGVSCIFHKYLFNVHALTG